MNIDGTNGLACLTKVTRHSLGWVGAFWAIAASRLVWWRLVNRLGRR